jgi:hypothetical protein
MDAFPSTLAVACGAIESVFVHHENDSHPVHRRMIRFFTLVGSMGLREPPRQLTVGTKVPVGEGLKR